MKKKFLYTAIFAAMIGLASCNEDFNADVAAPQTWEQEEILATASMTITPATGVNLETTTEETVKLFDYQVENQLEGSTIENLTAYISKQDVEAWQKIEVDANGKANVESLQSVMEELFGKSAEMRTLNIKAEASMNIDGEALYLGSEKVLIEITPKKPLVLTLPEYYLVGNIQNWSPVEKTAPLFPTETDNKFTVITDFSNSNAGTPNFKIWASDDFGTWEKALGAQTDGDTSLNGILKENGGAILTPDNGIYTFTVDFTTNNYSLVKEANQTPAEFLTIGLIGEFNGWGDDLDMLPSSPHNWYYPGFDIETEGQIKFRADDKWDNSWGGVINLSETPFGISQFKSNDNMTIPAGTYDVLFNDITGRYAFYKK